MDIFWSLLFFVSLLAFIVFLILTLVALIKKNDKVKHRLIFTGGSLALMFISFIATGQILLFGGVLLIGSLITFIVFLILTLVALIKKNGKVKRRLIFTGGSLALIFTSFLIIGVSSNPNKNVPVAYQEPEESTLTPEEELAQQAEIEAMEKAEAERIAQEEEKALAKKRESAQTIEYGQLVKNPNRYAGTYVKYTGEIAEIKEDQGKDNYTYIRLAVTKDPTFGFWSGGDIIWVDYNGYTDFIDGDVITVYGEISGEYSYTSQAGWNITLPAMLADTVEQAKVQ